MHGYWLITFYLVHTMIFTIAWLLILFCVIKLSCAFLLRMTFKSKNSYSKERVYKCGENNCSSLDIAADNGQPKKAC